MKILAIDTAGETASAAAAGADGQIYEVKNADSLDHLKSMMQLISSVLSEHGIRKNELDGIAVSIGPGSFTGIRIGMAAARTMAQVLQIPVAPVMTLDAFLFQELPVAENGVFCPMIDARRGNVFAAAYQLPGGSKILEEKLYSVEEFLAQLPEDQPLIAAGSGASAYEEKIRELRKDADALTFSDASHHAASVLRCALHQQNFVNYNDAEPVYLRKAEAEVKRAEGKLGLRARKKKMEEEKQILQMPPKDEAVVYRSLTREDSALLAGVDQLCFHASWKEESFQGEFMDSEAAVYEGAFNPAGEMIGFAGAVSMLDEAEIRRVGVHPLYRTRGIGGVCLNRVLQRLEETRGTNMVFLEVREANRSAIALYKENGFRVIAKRKNYYQDTGENALIMQRTGEESSK